MSIYKKWENWITPKTKIGKFFNFITFITIITGLFLHYSGRMKPEGTFIQILGVCIMVCGLIIDKNFKKLSIFQKIEISLQGLPEYHQYFLKHMYLINWILLVLIYSFFLFIGIHSKGAIYILISVIVLSIIVMRALRLLTDGVPPGIKFFYKIEGNDEITWKPWIAEASEYFVSISFSHDTNMKDLKLINKSENESDQLIDFTIMKGNWLMVEKPFLKAVIVNLITQEEIMIEAPVGVLHSSQPEGKNPLTGKKIRRLI